MAFRLLTQVQEHSAAAAFIPKNCDLEQDLLHNINCIFILVFFFYSIYNFLFLEQTQSSVSAEHKLTKLVSEASDSLNKCNTETLYGHFGDYE